MFVLGVASLIQLLILPGALCAITLRLRLPGMIQRMLTVMGLSLYANYLLICLLTWLRIYLPSVMWSIVALECLALLALWARGWWHPPTWPSPHELHRRFTVWLLSLSASQRTAMLWASFLLTMFVCLIGLSAGSTYYFSDALMHWTRWPGVWAANAFPADTGHYPQLFSADLSLITVFTQDPGLQFFQKALMPLFFIGILLMFLDLFITTRDSTYLAGFFVYAAFLLIFYALLFILEVNADLPVSFLGFLIFYTLERPTDNTTPLQPVLLACIFAAGAANTKLVGLSMFLPLGFWCARALFSRSAPWPRREILRTLWAAAGILLSGLIWYAVRPAAMAGGVHDTAVYLAPTYAARLSNAVSMLYYTAGFPLVIMLLVTIGASLLVSKSRELMLIIIVPSLVIWALSFSADYRNLSCAIPFAAYASGSGLMVLRRRFAKPNAGEILRLSSLISGITTPGVRRAIALLGFACLALAAGTGWFFNAGMNLAYFFHVVLFRGYAIGYLTELGYYRYVELYCAALRWSSVAAMIVIGMRAITIRSSVLLPALAMAGILGGSLFVSKDRMHQMQQHDAAMVSMRNLYARVHPFLHGHTHTLLVSNNPAFGTLILPSTVAVIYADPPEPAAAAHTGAAYDALFLLIDKRMPHALRPDGPPHDDAFHSYAECFDDGEFLMLRVYEKMEAAL